MTEQAPASIADESTTDPELVDEPVRTGVPAVDQVLADVDAMHELPLDQHVTAFERAHESLRDALDSRPDTPA